MLLLIVLSALQNKPQRNIKEFEAEEIKIYKGIPRPISFLTPNIFFVFSGVDIEMKVNGTSYKNVFGYFGSSGILPVIIQSDTEQTVKLYRLDPTTVNDDKAIVERRYLITKTNWQGDLSYDYDFDGKRNLQTKFYVINPNGFTIGSWFNSEELGLNITDSNESVEPETMTSFFRSSVEGRTSVLAEMDIKKDQQIRVKGKRWIQVSGDEENSIPEVVLEVTDHGCLSIGIADDEIIDYSGLIGTVWIFVLVAIGFVLLIVIITVSVCFFKKKCCGKGKVGS
jgi:tRNA(Leu) C34 or U34 (ribose-2'-O)-methylase TrmL